jgi:tripartite-type tricarboxylate transporter receptor subunit TctC
MGLIGKKEKINWKAVPFKGLADCIPPLLGGHITSIAGLGGAHLDQVRAGKMRLLVIYGSGRLPSFPNIPTLIDEGYGFSIAFDNGLAGPKGIDPVILKKLEDVFATAAKDPKFQRFVKDNDMILTYMNGTQYAQFLKQNYELRVPLLQEIGLAFK